MVISLLRNRKIKDLILPSSQKELLYKITERLHGGKKDNHNIMNLQHPHELEFKSKKRVRGITALFVGNNPHFTTPVVVAEALTSELGLDLCHIELSLVVSRYLGETEKNLKKVFDVAVESNAILFFDEADALFGRRSDLIDDYDRYSRQNRRLDCLLKNMESNKGLVILRIDKKNAVADPALTKYFDFIINFDG